jgi:hypothetical protein
MLLLLLLLLLLMMMIMPAMCTVYLILLDLFTTVIINKLYKLQSYSLCSITTTFLLSTGF